MEDTLIIDMSGRAVGLVSWRRAVKLLWEGCAEVVVEDAAGKVLTSPSFEMGMPRVIRVRNYVTKKMRKSIPCSRRNIAVRDKSLCQYCGVHLRTEEYTLDHVIPRSQGGTTTWMNTVLACTECNSYKDGRTPAQAGMRLLHKPIEPKPRDPGFFKLRITKLRPEWEEWQKWLYAENASWTYWNVELDK